MEILLKILTIGKKIPPRGRHLDRITMVPQAVGDLAVGIGAGKRLKRASADAIEASSGLKQADHRHMTQVIKRVGGAAGEVAGDLVCQNLVGQCQGVNSGVGVAEPLVAWRGAGSPSTKPQ